MSALTIGIASTGTAATGFGTVGISGITVAGALNPPVANSLTLASGNNTIAVPSGAVGVVIVPPAANAIVLLYKTTSGDTGILIPVATPDIKLFATGSTPANIIINAASATSGLTQVLFF